MKYYTCILAALAKIFCYSSCKKQCVTAGITSVHFSGNNLSDTSATVIQYKKGGNFTDVVDTFNDLYSSGSVVFPTSSNWFIAYSYDWIIILQPSGKTYKIKNIAHESDDMSTFLSVGEVDICVNEITYVVNDTILNTVSHDGRGDNASAILLLPDNF